MIFVSSLKMILRTKNIIIFLLNFEILYCNNNQPIDWTLYVSTNNTKLKASYKFINNLNGIDVFKDSLIDLDLYDNKLINIDQLESMKKLKFLKLNTNRIENVKSLCFLTELIELSLSINQIININCFNQLINVKKLILSRNKITNVKSLANLINLKELNLDGNLIKDFYYINENSFQSLEILNLNYNRIENIKNITRLTQLSKLYLAANQIKDIDSISNLNKLIKIDLSKNFIKNFKELEKLINLNNINLDEMNIIESINFNSKLTTVSLSNNQLTNLINFNGYYLEDLFLISNSFKRIGNNDICGFKRLQLLFLNYNQLENVDCLEELNQMQFLSLSNNKIKNVDTILNNLDQLLFLDISHNKIENIRISNEKILEKLVAHNNQISNIIDISKLKALTDLDLSFNKITNIDSIGNLSKLEGLYLNGNTELECIDSLSNLDSLVYLNLEGNRIKKIDSLTKNFKLKYLSLKNNQIVDVNPLKDMKNIDNLILSNNMIKFIDRNFLSQNDIINYIDLSNNQLKLFEPFGLNTVVYLNLSFNKLKNMSFVSKYKKIENLYINNNELESEPSLLNDQISILIGSNQLHEIDISFNDKINEFKVNVIGQGLNYFQCDKVMIKNLLKLKNLRIVSKKSRDVFLKSFNIIVKNDLSYVDCLVQLDFLKRNINMNLVFQFQIDSFINIKCKNIELWDILNLF